VTGTANRVRIAPLLWCVLGLSLLWSKTAVAEIKLGEAGGWEIFTDGRINAFGSYATGDKFPDVGTPIIRDANGDGMLDTEPGPSVVGGPFGAGTNQGDLGGQVGAARVRSGFVSNVLAFGFKKKLTPTTTLRGYFALWSGIESEGDNSRFRGGKGWLDIRQAFLEVDGLWGTLLVGRNLGLFSRAAVEINYSYQHAYALGHPCGIDGNGPTCGHIGFGVIYPGFDPGIVYSTPSLGGLKLTVGIYDPVVLTAYMTRTPFPRPEAELAFERKFGLGMVKLFANALWQRLESGAAYQFPAFLPSGEENCVKDPADPMMRACLLGPAGNETPIVNRVKRDAWGVGAGGRLELGPMRFGGTAFTGVGLGTHYPIQHSPSFLFNAETYELRRFDGFYATIAAVIQRVTLHVGYGQVNVHRMNADLFPENPDPANTFAKPRYSIPRYQYGISGGLTVKISDQLFWSADVFRQHSQWYPIDTTDTMTNVTTRYGNEKQDLLFVNTGVTMTW
jgi:hypothetical protein